MREAWNEVEIGEVWPRGHHGPSRTLTWRGDEYVLDAGRYDELGIWVDDDDETLIVVVLNENLPYCGIEVFHNGGCIHNEFHQEYGGPLGDALRPDDEEYDCIWIEDVRDYYVARSELWGN